MYYYDIGTSIWLYISRTVNCIKLYAQTTENYSHIITTHDKLVNRVQQLVMYSWIEYIKGAYCGRVLDCERGAEECKLVLQ